MDYIELRLHQNTSQSFSSLTWKNKLTKDSMIQDENTYALLDKLLYCQWWLLVLNRQAFVDPIKKINIKEVT